MSPKTRGILGATVAAVFLGLYIRAATGLPGFGHYPAGAYGDIMTQIGVTERHTTDIVSAINFDYRGIDTVGEEFILLTAATGAAVILRREHGERRVQPKNRMPGGERPSVSEAVRLASLIATAPMALLGLYVITHGQVTPGGGFQGGVILASAFMMVYLAGDYLVLRSVAPQDVVEAAEALGAGGFVVIGTAALVAGHAFLTNLLPLGEPASIDSSGTIALISFAVGVEVTAAFVLLLRQFLEQVMQLQGDRTG